MSSVDEPIAAKARKLFSGPLEDLTIAGAPDMPGMRYNGHRWVAEDSLDTIRTALQQDPQEYFVGIEHRRLPAVPPRQPKTRRRGGF